MRIPGRNDRGVSAYCVTGAYVALMGFDATEEARQGLLGFAIHRTDITEKEQYWLQGFRTFEATFKNPPQGSLVSTHEHPVQDFLWSDFTAKPDHDYVYKIVPVYGAPKNIEYGPAIEMEVRTESETADVHSVYFNRGAIGSQAYARKFDNISPDKLQGEKREEAFAWLSRGLEEAMLGFIAQGEKPGMGLRAAVYEFSYEPVVAAFSQAKKKGRDVQIVYDARIPSSEKNKDAAEKRVAAVKALLQKYGLSGVSTPRTDSGNYISHNKFIVLLDRGKPAAVWTGSTNFTESGIFGQSNVGHVVRDPATAQAFFDYWTRLQQDPAAANLREENGAASPNLQSYPSRTGTTPIFSPRQDLEMLDWYATAMGKAGSLMCFTAAFGVNKVFLEVLEGERKHLNYIFLDKWGVNKSQSEKTKVALGHDVYNQVAVGGYLDSDALKDYLANRWAQETFNPLSKNVRYVHTKYMLVDPLSEDPLVITGSANFSDASTRQNDENMLIIRGDKRVADIYLGEFMRLWQHYRFRYIENKKAEEGATDGYQPNYLDPTPAWTVPYYKPGSVKFRKRKAFSAPAAASATASR